MGRDWGATPALRCGTSSAPNYDEACSAESRDDFAHKLSIAAKEMRETRGWLRFIIIRSLLPEKKVATLLDEAEQLLRMSIKSVKTAKQRCDFPIPPSPSN